MIDYSIREDTKAYEYCRMTTSPEVRSYPSASLQIGFPIGSSYSSAFDELN